MKTRFNLWPGGRLKCLTLSYDDGVIEDRQLISIMNHYGIRGTFHINGRFSQNNIEPAEIVSLYAGHEVSIHMVTHPFPTQLTREEILNETLENRRMLESFTGYPIRGMSYPFGDYDSRVIDLLRACGIEYSRTTMATNSFLLPTNWLEWHPTCHHSNCLSLADQFLEISANNNFGKGLFCFYIWGHSYEFSRNNSWDFIENFCKKMSNREDIWYATNMEIVDYIHAVHAVRSSVDGTILYNPSAISVWLTILPECKIYELKAGETFHIA
jgi:hypothetical protein